MASEDGEPDGIIERALDWTLRNALTVDAVAERAYLDRLRSKHRNKSPRQLAELLVDRAKWKCAAWGAATGLPSNPWTAAPAAVADLGVVLRLQVILAARIALIYDDTYLDDGEPPYELLVPILGGSMASEFMREVAIRGGMGVSRAAIRKYISKETLTLLKRLALKYLGLKLTQKGLITKTLPIVGGVVGGGWNYVEVRTVGRRVIEYFEGRPLPPGETADLPIEPSGDDGNLPPRAQAVDLTDRR